MYSRLADIKQKLSKKQYDSLITLYGDILQSIGKLIENKINSCKYLNLETCIHIAESATRHAHQNMLVQIFKEKDISYEEVAKLISEITKNSIEEIINRLKDIKIQMPFILYSDSIEKRGNEKT